MAGEESPQVGRLRVGNAKHRVPAGGEEESDRQPRWLGRFNDDLQGHTPDRNRGGMRPWLAEATNGLIGTLAANEQRCGTHAGQRLALVARDTARAAKKSVPVDNGRATV